MRYQKRGREKRKRLSASAEKKIRAEVERFAKYYKCSKSFIIAVALADFFELKIKRFDE